MCILAFYSRTVDLKNGSKYLCIHMNTFLKAIEIGIGVKRLLWAASQKSLYVGGYQ